MGGFLDDWQAWRDGREERLRNPQGWLAITAIHWLTEEPQRFDDVPGEWRHDQDGPVVVLPEGERRLGPVDENGITLTLGDVVAEVADRDGTTIVRPRHPDSPNLRAYRGTPCYPPDPAWVVPARHEPSGEVVFERDGVEHRLLAETEDDGCLWILFRDATSGVTTYGAMRQLLTSPPAPDGSVEIDFNRAYNMPCAYTDFATCPVPPAQNTLPFAVVAGEKIPDMTSPEQTARNVVAGLQAAVDSHDADALTECFAPGAVLIGTAGYSSGDTAVRQYLEAVATVEMLRWHLETYDVFLSTPDVLGFAAEGEVEWRDADGADRKPFRLTVVAVADGPHWRIQHFHGSLSAG